MKKLHISVLFIELGIGAFLRFFNLLYFHTLDSDEAVYAQAVFAVTKGYIPYKDIFFAHPPVYLYMEYPIMWVSSSVLALRIFNAFLGIATICLLFYTGRLMYSERTGLIASCIYALYPLAIYGNKLALVDNGLIFFITLTLFFFVNYLKEEKIKYLVLSGVFSGISFMTKYTAILVICALLLFSLFTFFRKKIMHLFIYMVCAIIFPLAIFLLLLLTNIWPFFFVQTIQWQTIRFGMYASEKFSFFLPILLSLLPLIIPAMLATPINMKDKNWQLLMVLFFAPLAALPFSKVVFFQYAFSLLPPICILVAKGIDSYIPKDFSLTRSIRKIFHSKMIRKKIFTLRAIILAFVCIFAIILLFIGLFYCINPILSTINGNESSATFMQNQIDLGNWIKNLTKPDDKIWTTDASIAFFAGRTIVEPNSEYWKFQGFFQDVWGYGWTREDYRGPIKEYPTGLISIHDIQIAWEKERPKVIVIIGTSTADYFIWNGIQNSFQNEEGLANYIKSFYSLELIFYPQNIEVWVKK